ncbi:hypothetical protein Tco_1147905, partial [Tanacetum coccineum]
SSCEVEDGIFWRRAAGVRESCLEETISDPSTFGSMRMTWRQFILALGLHTEKEMAEAGFGAYWDGSDRLIPDKGGLRDYWMKISSDIDFLGPAPSYVLIRDPMRRLCHKMIAYSISGRGQAPEKLGRLNSCTRYGDTWAWVAQGPKRQQTTTASSHKADKAGQAAEEWIKRIKEEVHDLWRDVVGLRGVIESFTTEQSRVSTWLITCKTQLIDASGETYQPFDSTLIGPCRNYDMVYTEKDMCWTYPGMLKP